MRSWAGAGLAFAMIACSSSSPGSGDGFGGNGSDEGASLGAGSQFASAICTNIAACNITVSNCELSYEAVVLSSACQAAFLNASCADLSSPTAPPDLSACLPPCTSAGTNVCNGNGTITACTNDEAITVTCPGTCAAKGLTFTGTCGATYMGSVAANGDECWCE